MAQRKIEMKNWNKKKLFAHEATESWAKKKKLDKQMQDERPDSIQCAHFLLVATDNADDEGLATRRSEEKLHEITVNGSE